jgi:hypothetical protein
MWTRRLRCPHCQGEFDYDLVPGMSATALRLGTSRYMRCPLCRRFGVFSLKGTKGEDGGATPGAASGSGTGGALEFPGAPEAVPRFDDRRPLVRWGALLLVPAMLLTLAGVLLSLPMVTRLLLVAGGVIVLGVGSALMIGFSLPDRVR